MSIKSHSTWTNIILYISRHLRVIVYIENQDDLSVCHMERNSSRRILHRREEVESPNEIFLAILSTERYVLEKEEALIPAQVGIRTLAHLKRHGNPDFSRVHRVSRYDTDVNLNTGAVNRDTPHTHRKSTTRRVITERE